MEKYDKKMDNHSNMIPYFSGLHFHVWGDVPDSAAILHNKTFNGYYGIQYNHSGEMEFAIGDDPVRRVSGSYAFISYPGERFHYGGERRHHVFVCFSGTPAERFLQGGLLCPGRHEALIPVTNADSFYAVMRQLQALLNQPGGSGSPRAVWLLEDLLLQLHEQPQRKKYSIPRICETALADLRDRILKNPVADWNISEEAKKLSISEAHFRRLFREAAGVPVHRFLIEAKLKCAAELLQTSDLPLSEIAHRCGFQDEFYFSRLFKLHRKITAFSYRKEYQIRS